MIEIKYTEKTPSATEQQQPLEGTFSGVGIKWGLEKRNISSELGTSVHTLAVKVAYPPV